MPGEVLENEVLELLSHWEAAPHPRYCPRCGEIVFSDSGFIVFSDSGFRATRGEPCQPCRQAIYTEDRIAEFEEAEAREKEAYYECH